MSDCAWGLHSRAGGCAGCLEEPGEAAGGPGWDLLCCPRTVCVMALKDGARAFGAQGQTLLATDVLREGGR